VIDVMTRLKVHHMAEGGAREADIAEKCGINVRSVEWIRTEAPPSAAEVASNQRAGSKRVGRKPKASPEIVTLARADAMVPEARIRRSEVGATAEANGLTSFGSCMLSDVDPTPIASTSSILHSVSPLRIPELAVGGRTGALVEVPDQGIASRPREQQRPLLGRVGVGRGPLTVERR
jgi:hypothetical protein